MLFSRMPAGATRPSKRDFVLIIPIARHRRIRRLHALLRRILWLLDELHYRIRPRKGVVWIGTWML